MHQKYKRQSFYRTVLLTWEVEVLKKLTQNEKEKISQKVSDSENCFCRNNGVSIVVNTS